MDTILGQSHAIDVLQAGFASQRLHHAYVFHGPIGVGKFTTARAFAKVLLCHQPQQDLAGRAIACDQCESCRLLRPTPADADAKSNKADDTASLAAAHPDLHVITKELARFSDDGTIRGRKLTTIPVSILREHVVATAFHSPQLKHNKVYIIDEADLMNLEGQNTLLKTLEEPPPGTFLILVTSNEDRLLITIRSRCQRIAFVPLDDGLISHWLDQHGADLAAADRNWLTDFAAGSIGRAKMVIDFDLVPWSRDVLPAIDRMAQGQFPPHLGEVIGQHIDDFANAWVDAHDGASKEAANKRAADMMWAMISQHTRKRMRDIAATCDANDPVAAEQALAPYLGIIDAIHTAETNLAANVMLKLAAAHLVSMMYRASSQPMAAI